MIEMSEEARNAAKSLALSYGAFIVNVTNAPTSELDRQMIVNGRMLLNCYDALGIELLSRETVLRILAAAAWRASKN